jgi:RNA polymerase sigma-70 factor (ECF subfamily)
LSQVPETRDSLLLRLADAADHEAWCRFTAVYRPLVYRIARRRGLQDADAQDLAQRVLLSVSGAIGQWKKNTEKAKFRTWLHTVARNAVIDHLRSRRLDAAEGGTAAQLQLQQATDDHAADVESELEREYQRELFRWAAREVRTEFEQATWLAFWWTAVEGRTVPEVAAELGKTAGAVYIARSRVMQRLRSKVTESADED